MGRSSGVIVLMLLVLMLASPAPAREEPAFGIEIIFNDIGGEANAGKDISAGNGLGLRGGYGISRSVAVEAAVWSTEHDVRNSGPIRSTGATIGIKYTVPRDDSHIEPFLLGGAGSYTLGQGKGTGGYVGIGMDIDLVPAQSLVVGLTRHFIDLDTQPSSSCEVTSLSVGLFYRFP